MFPSVQKNILISNALTEILSTVSHCCPNLYATIKTTTTTTATHLFNLPTIMALDQKLLMPNGHNMLKCPIHFIGQAISLLQLANKPERISITYGGEDTTVVKLSFLYSHI